MNRGEDSSTSRERAERSRLVCMQAAVVFLWAQRVDTPTEEIEAAILAITDFERLVRMGKRIVDPALAAPSWDDLLAIP